MPTHELVMMISQLGVGAVATFLAMLLWSTTREAAWLFVILGIISRYGETMYNTFSYFGIIPSSTYQLFDVQIVPLMLNGLPMLCFALACIIKLGSKS